MTIALTGLGSGALHALSGPDHFLSLVPLSVGRGRGAWRVGLVWGIGHGVGTLAAASVLLLALSAANLEIVNVWAERIAGGALVGLGAANLVALRRARSKPHPEGRSGARGTVFTIGLVHGLTGAAALLLLLPAAAASGLHQVAYLAGFTVGSTAAMAGLTSMLARASRSRIAPRVMQRVPKVASVASIVAGVAWALAAG
jgi:hypothetical protein